MVTIGETVSHYRILEKIGSGGMGVVFRAEDTRLHRQVALKFLPEGIVRNRESLERFHREAHAASALNHPNICVIYDIDEHQGQPFIAMELLEGQTLKQYLATRALSMDEVLERGLQIADALDAAHAKGIIHRDVKPGNIMVSERGQVKVLDFGLAKLAHEGGRDASASPMQDAVSAGAVTSGVDSLTRVGAAVGTPAYMSPEQIAGHNPDRRSDLFSLGAVLYEMATRQRAFPGDSPGAVLENILIHTPAPPSRTNPQCSTSFDELIRKSLERDREMRYQTASDMRADMQRLRRDSSATHEFGEIGPRSDRLTAATRARLIRGFRSLSPVVRWNLAAAVVLVLALVAGQIYRRSHHGPSLTEKDTVLLTDFANTTGDPVFDGILKQALSVKLSESPFLNIFPETGVHETLRSMDRSPDERVTPAVGRDICARQGIKAMITGEIASLGSQYVITLSAVNSRTGEPLAQEQTVAMSKEGVLSVLDGATSKLREKLGESLSSIKKFDTPLQQATTSSLEAFTAYNMGVEQAVQKGSEQQGIRFLKRAIELDPRFAMAYSLLSSRYANLGEGDLAAKYAEQAFRLRDRAGERERFIITARYYDSVTGEVDKEIETCLLWKQLYPRDNWAPIYLGVAYGQIGQFQKALDQFLQARELAPNEAYSYLNLGWMYACLGRFRESREVYAQALARGFDVFSVYEGLYFADFMENNAQAMQRDAAGTVGKPEEYGMLFDQAETKAYYGELRKARDLFRQAAETAARAHLMDNAAMITANEAMIEASFGNPAEARSETARAMALAHSRNVVWPEACALAVSGNVHQAKVFADDSVRRFPKDTLVNAVYVPFLRAGLALRAGHPNRAVSALQPAIPYERAFWQVPFLRGQAYLKAGEGSQAAAQFQKALDYRGGTAVNHPWQALARLYLGRARAMTGERGGSREAYRDFLNLWKDADPDIPILKEAKAEYARLQ